MPASGVYRGVPAAERQAARRRRLLDAALDLLGTEGAQATTVRAVCRRAQLTPRFFYESFEDLDALLVAVFDEVVQAATARMLEALGVAGADQDARARAAIGAFVDALTEDPRVARVVCLEALGSEPLMRRRLAVVRSMTQLVAEHARAEFRPPPDAEPLVDLTATVLVGGLAEVLISWLDGGLRQDRDQLVDDFAALFVATGAAAADVAVRRARAKRLPSP
ncbi:TetR/AcrR family transcriptional regulator [Conexibacter sp. SYSU D00693]|uniref:TetR/AcrR family transcriptional regulator n=1 Tax=Conexibacter sp. SYSU D00693 TaxID=2812560 RepID=UPI00196A303A|nr:TetR/AcrR family transcriptional regulator [Conexibacter sp. SYSU D00693]